MLVILIKVLRIETFYAVKFTYVSKRKSCFIFKNKKDEGEIFLMKICLPYIFSKKINVFSSQLWLNHKWEDCLFISVGIRPGKNGPA